MTTNPTPTQPGETLEPPERIRVVIRAATSDDWIGVAYCKDYTGDPSTIHEYVRAVIAGPRGDELTELFDLFEKDQRGRWCFKSLSLDGDKLDSIMDRLAAALSSTTPAESVLKRLTDDRCGFCGGKTAHEPDCDHGVTAPPERTRVAGEHPEDFCHKCGRPNIVWFAPNELWNKSVRAAGELEILCPVCFVQLAEAAGFDGVWRVAPQTYNNPSDSARRAAGEIADYVSDGILGMGNEVTEANRAKFFEIVSNYLPRAATPADNDALEVCRLLTTLDWIVGYELTGENQMILDRAQQLALKVMGMSDPTTTTKGDR